METVSEVTTATNNSTNITDTSINITPTTTSFFSSTSSSSTSFSSSTSSSSSSSFSVSSSPAAINLAHLVTYKVALPLEITIGILVCGLSIIILRRPALKSLQVNKYFQLLLWIDILVFLVHIPIVISVNGCTFPNYALAWYFTHLGWTTIAGVHSFCAYILCWLAVDRCLAVWWHPGYSFMERTRVQRIRIIVTAVLCVLIQIPYIIQAGVVCINSNSNSDYAEVMDPYCSNGTWSEIDGHQYSFNERWNKIYRWFYGGVVRGGPGFLLLIFNLSLVVAVAQGRVRDRTRPKPEEGHKKKSSRNWERNLVITMISMATSYLAFALPITVFLIFFAQNDPDHCSKDNAAETLRHTANCLLLLEHMLHPVFLTCLNPTFRRELLIFLRFDKARIKSWGLEMSGERTGPSTPLTSVNNTPAHNTPVIQDRHNTNIHHKNNRLTPNRNSPIAVHHKHDSLPNPFHSLPQTDN